MMVEDRANDEFGMDNETAERIIGLALIESVILFANLWRGPLFIASMFFLALAPMLFFGTRMLLQFIELRGKYARIYEIRKELEM